MEVALSNYAARGQLDGVSLRPAGVMARDGADAALKSAFMSRLFWSVKRGEDVTLPVAPESRAWMSSIETVARNFIHAAKLPEIGPNRAFTLPALSPTFGDVVDALRRRFPASRSKIAFAPDPDVVALFGAYPRLETATASGSGATRTSTLWSRTRFPDLATDIAHGVAATALEIFPASSARSRGFPSEAGRRSSRAPGTIPARMRIGPSPSADW